jgi:hypothetical protein
MICIYMRVLCLCRSLWECLLNSRCMIHPELVLYIVRGCHWRSIHLKSNSLWKLVFRGEEWLTLVFWWYSLFDNTCSYIVLYKCLLFSLIELNNYVNMFVDHNNFIPFIIDRPKIVDKIRLLINVIFLRVSVIHDHHQVFIKAKCVCVRY